MLDMLVKRSYDLHRESILQAIKSVQEMIKDFLESQQRQK